MKEEKNIYVGNRYVPKIMGEWNQAQSYESLSIVIHDGASYTSVQSVPENVAITNEIFWVVTGNYNAQVEFYRQAVLTLSNEFTAYKASTESQLAKIPNESISAKSLGLTGVGDETNQFLLAVETVGLINKMLDLEKMTITISGINATGKTLVQNGTVKRLTGTSNNLFIAGVGDRYKNLLLDGSAISAGNGNGIFIDGSTDVEMDNVTFINQPNDGIYARNTSKLRFKNMNSKDNFRNGLSVTDNVFDVIVDGWNADSDKIAGIDIEPNSSSKVNNHSIIMRNLVISNTWLSLYGYSNTIWINDVSINDVVCKNGGKINVTRVNNLSIKGLTLLDTADLSVNYEVGGGYGGHHMNIEDVSSPLVSSYNKVKNGNFNDLLTNWTKTVTSPNSIVEVLPTGGITSPNVLHVKNVLGEYAFAVGEYIPVTPNNPISITSAIHALIGRPYLNIQFKESETGAVIKEIRLSPKTLNKFQKVIFAGLVPIGATVVRLSCGGTTGEVTEGYFDGVTIKDGYNFEA